MRAVANTDVTFSPTPCCGRMHFEYQTGTMGRSGVVIEVWLRLRCLHCRRVTKIIGFAKKAGDEALATRKRKSRQTQPYNIVRQSTAISLEVRETGK